MPEATDLDGSEELRTLSTVVAGRYAIERELGRGGMGVVYLARERTLDRLVALKVLPAQFMAQPTLRERFLRETQLVAGMSHPNIVPIYAVEEHPGAIFYAMGFIDGESLTERVKRAGPLPAGEVARVMQEAAWALSYAHSRGVVHRDVKPDNILIERATGRALLMDFGISRVADSTMTSLGESLGTPQFMSPEQASGEVVDPRSDLYSLGATAFFALTGRAPFDAPSVRAILAMHITKPAPTISSVSPGTPPALAAAIDRCLAKAPEDRWPSAESLVEALQQIRAMEHGIAPQVRNFQRASEMSTTTVISFFLLLPSVAIVHPEAARMLMLILAVLTIMTVWQLTTQARLLREQGFGYDDLRSAFESDMRAARDAASLPISRDRRRMWVLLIGGICVFGAGGLLASRVHLHSALGTVAAGLLGFGVVLIVLFLASLASRFFAKSMASRRRFGPGANRIAVKLWTGAAGRLFFRLAAPPVAGA